MIKFFLYLLLSGILLSHTLEEIENNIFSGGVPKDGIPPIESPVYLDIEEGNGYMSGNDIVFILESSTPKIIPQKILVWHEIINDKLERRNIAITYCPLTSSVVGYYPSNNNTLGVSGKLVNSNLVIYDRETESLWPQVMGRAVQGERKGDTLEHFPLVWTTWEKAAKKYPYGKVLSRDTGSIRNYERDPYGDYFSQDSYYNTGGAFFPLMSSDDTLPPKAMVRGLIGEKSTAAVPWELIKKKGIINVTHGDIRAVVFYDPELDTVRAFSRKFRGEELEFYMEDGKIRDRGVNRVWNLRGESGVHSLTPHKGMDAFWFAWHAFYPESKVVGDIDED